MDQEQIKECIPHRDPFLWIDEVLELSENTIHATTYINPDLPVFQGHYPDFPILPGVLQCEMALQAGAILISRKHALEADKVPVATRINNVKFKHMVRPGDTANVYVEVTERLKDTFYMTGKIVVDGQTCTRLDFAATATDSPG
ncbi:3-hydroxyacyl-ACP dehydratase FabZ family protein [Rubinisphaera sp.]|uniref:3-hydroxyacyl-ACP dehydratase FabZ family protein n=1 Tax=Rubinisphaera sp. TaxID=2024857 RepID=UPI000C0F459A|nr:3-hydroxyacyl-ACP dehydratase FabZ family protein [Rubinisphaera sp.]MBV12316.1 beta-hydroxyacyl-ACP dehydratase [Rubinisphaera sp.]HCS54553.1 beta-hydroxyacyl-ACP dehydratase [Planctomycetaceae bacterium]|tara:strand:- start:7237 stop:7668 length:432 start_codon:yes stop_codon:yes gene_type:complete